MGWSPSKQVTIFPVQWLYWIWQSRYNDLSYYPVKVGGHRQSGSGDIMFKVCQWFQKTTWQKMWLYGEEPLMVIHYSAKCGGYRHCASGDVIFSVVKRNIPDALVSIYYYCISPENMTWENTVYHINNSDPDHKRLK